MAIPVAYQGWHAEVLRSLIGLVPGKPAIIANCHPTKNAGADKLIPASGENFLNSVDGNFTAAKTDSTTEMHWQGKIRGIEFAPMHFMLKTVTHQDLKDSGGNLIYAGLLPLMASLPDGVQALPVPFTLRSAAPSVKPCLMAQGIFQSPSALPPKCGPHSHISRMTGRIGRDLQEPPCSLSASKSSTLLANILHPRGADRHKGHALDRRLL